MRILVTEDDTVLRIMLTDFLTGLGHKVNGTDNGAELVKLAQSEGADLLITDLYIPGTGEGSVIAMMGKHPALEKLPVIVITGSTDRESAEPEIPGVVHIFPKPFDLARLAEKISHIERGLPEDRLK